MSNTNQPEQIISNGVVSIAGGGGFSLFLKSDGSLWGMGSGVFGQLGETVYVTNRPVQIVSSNVVAIAGAWQHCLFLKSDGCLYVMGANQYGQLGIGGVGSTNKPTLVDCDVIAVAKGCEAHHSLYLKSDGVLWGMGQDTYYQLGDGFTGNCQFPERIVPAPEPVLTSISIVSNTNLQLVGTCYFGGLNYLLATTNLSDPPGPWTTIWTNTISIRGSNNFTLTDGQHKPSSLNIDPNVAQQFYILQSQ